MFLLEFAGILLLARIGGIIAKYFKQPVVLGEIIAGILMGPAVFGIINNTQTLSDLAQIGVVLLMFLAGIETDIREMKKSGKASTLVALGGVIVPLLLTYFICRIFNFDSSTALFFGVISTATSVSITVQTLRELNMLKSKQGCTILGAAVIDDILGIILLTIVIALIKPSSSESILFVLAKILIYFVLAYLISKLILGLFSKYKKTIIAGDHLVILTLVFCFVMAFIAEEFGVASIIGSYFAGLAISQSEFKYKVSLKIQQITYLAFTPVFFTSIGLNVNLSGFSDVALFSIVFVIVAIIGKIIGCGIMAKYSKFNLRESIQIGIGMVARGEVVLIITDIGMRVGVLNQSVSTTIILMVVATSIFTPPLLKIAFSSPQ